MNFGEFCNILSIDNSSSYKTKYCHVVGFKIQWNASESEISEKGETIYEHSSSIYSEDHQVEHLI